MSWSRRALACGLGLLLVEFAAPGPAVALDEVTLGIGGEARAEHGGYYEAVAYGIYRNRYDLEVTVRRVDPPVDPAGLLVARELDFSVGGNSFQQFDLARNNAGVVSVAAFFQKDPAALLAHPGAGVARLEDLRGRTLFMSDHDRRTLWPWLRKRYRLDDGQVKPYAQDLGPFLAEPGSVLAGDVASAGLAVAKQGGFEPAVILPANDTYCTYPALIQTSWQLVRENPDLVQRFVDATIEGWYRYLYDDNARADALIKAANAEMTDDRLASALGAMKRHGLVDSGDALMMGVGAMNGGRWVNSMKNTIGWTRPTKPPFDRMYSLQFVNQGHGLYLEETLIGE
jgi:NitT/TauT family transport system substrate-binding protein